MDQDLKGKLAFVTGSGRGLGSFMARRLAQRGADVVVHDLAWEETGKFGEARNLGEVVKEMQSLGVRSMGVTGNIGDRNAIAAMKSQIENELGAVEILVNCAGGDIGASGGKPVPNDLLGIPYEDIVALTTNNLIGTMLMCQAFVNPMRERGHGIVVNIGSTAAHVGVPNGSVYAVLKAGVVHYPLPRPRGAGRRRARQLRQPRPDQDGPVPGNARGRSGEDGLLRQVVRPLCGARRDRRCRRVPVQPAGQVRARPGATRRWRQPAVHELSCPL